MRGDRITLPRRCLRCLRDELQVLGRSRRFIRSVRGAGVADDFHAIREDFEPSKVRHLVVCSRRYGGRNPPEPSSPGFLRPE